LSNHMNHPPDARVNFDFRLFVKQNYIDSGVTSWSVLEEIAKDTNIDQIYIDKETEVPDVPGKILIFRAGNHHEEVS
jgi:hypothetical protein